MDLGLQFLTNGLPDGRGGGIRTHGLFVPNEARYQAAPRPDTSYLRGSTEVVHPKGLEPLTF